MQDEEGPHRKMMPDLHRGVGRMSALENGVRAVAAAHACDAGHAHMLVAAKGPDSHHL